MAEIEEGSARELRTNPKADKPRDLDADQIALIQREISFILRTLKGLQWGNSSVW